MFLVPMSSKHQTPFYVTRVERRDRLIEDISNPAPSSLRTSGQ